MHKSLDFLKKQKTDIKKNVIFLDIDGVIQPYSNQYRFDHDFESVINHIVKKFNDDIYRYMDMYDLTAAYFDWDDVALGRLKQILRMFNAYIVIHSGWRESVSKEHLIALFKLHDLDGYIWDVCETGKKETVIKKFLNDHCEEIDKWIVIDDDNMFKDFGLNFCWTHDCLLELDHLYVNRVFSFGYSLDLNENILTFNRKSKSLAKLEYKILNISDRKIAYCKIIGDYGLSNYDTKALNQELYKFFNECGAFAFIWVGTYNDDKYSLINKDYTQKINDDCYLHYFDIYNNGLTGYKFFKDNVGYILEILGW